MIFCSLVIVGVLSKGRGRALRTPTTPRPASASASAMTPTVRLSLNYCKKTLRASEQDRPDIKQAREEWTEVRQPRMRLEPHRLIVLDESGATTKMTRL